MAIYRSARKLKWKQISTVKRSTKWMQLKFNKVGPCYHCGIKYTPLWRNGPPEKPVLCNACGSRWNLRRSLVNYTPKHAILVGNIFPRICRPIPIPVVNDCRKLVLALAAPSACYGKTISGKNEPTFLKPRFIPRRKRSVLIQQVLTPMERLNKELWELMNKDAQEVPEENEGDSVLIYVDTPNLMSTPLESPLGAMLLKPVTTDQPLALAGH